MDWVTPSIAIGNHLEAQDKELLRRERIQSVLSLDGSLQGRRPANLGLVAIEVVPLDDAPGNDPRLFRQAVNALSALVRDRGPVLVQCHAGRSRSAVVVAGYLVVSLGIEPEDALAQVAERREIAVTKGLERLLDALG
jgi:hypothetical protein